MSPFPTGQGPLPDGKLRTDVCLPAACSTSLQMMARNELEACDKPIRTAHLHASGFPNDGRSALRRLQLMQGLQPSLSAPCSLLGSCGLLLHAAGHQRQLPTRFGVLRMSSPSTAISAYLKYIGGYEKYYFLYPPRQSVVACVQTGIALRASVSSLGSPLPDLLIRFLW